MFIVRFVSTLTFAYVWVASLSQDAAAGTLVEPANSNIAGYSISELADRPAEELHVMNGETFGMPPLVPNPLETIRNPCADPGMQRLVDMATEAHEVLINEAHKPLTSGFLPPNNDRETWFDSISGGFPPLRENMLKVSAGYQQILQAVMGWGNNLPPLKGESVGRPTIPARVGSGAVGLSTMFFPGAEALPQTVRYFVAAGGVGAGLNMLPYLGVAGWVPSGLLIGVTGVVFGGVGYGIGRYTNPYTLGPLADYWYGPNPDRMGPVGPRPGQSAGKWYAERYGTGFIPGGEIGARTPSWGERLYYGPIGLGYRIAY